MVAPIFVAFVDGKPALLSVDQVRSIVGTADLDQRLRDADAAGNDKLAAIVDVANATSRDHSRDIADAFAQIEPITAANELLEQANIDTTAILRQADRDRAKLAAAQLGGLLDQNVQRITLRDAGMVADPDTGRIYLYAVDQTAKRTSTLEVALDAVTGQIALRATYDDVAAMITQAQLDPTSAAEFGAFLRRLTTAEVSIAGLNATIALKADAITVTQLGGIVQSLSLTLDALAGVVSTKVDYSDFTLVRDRVGSVEQVMQSYGDVSSYSVTIRQAELRETAGAAAQLGGLLTSFEDGRRQVVRAAEVQQQLYARLVDGDAAEAASRLLLSVRVGDAEGRIGREELVRASETAALTRSTDALGASLGEAVATIAADRTAAARADEAQTRARELLRADLGEATAQAGRDRQASVNRDSANARDISQVAGDLAAQGAIVSQLFEVVVTPAGSTAKALVVLDVNGRISGTRQTNDGRVSAFEVAADRFAVVDPASGERLFYVDSAGVVVGRLKAKSIETEQLASGSASRNTVWITTADVVIPTT